MKALLRWLILLIIITTRMMANDTTTTEDDFVPRGARLRDFLISKCGIFANGRPVANESDALSVSLRIMPERFIDIREMEQTFSIVAKVQVIWTHHCVQRYWGPQAVSREWSDVRILYESSAGAESMWHVPIFHVNGVDNVFLSEEIDDESGFVMQPGGVLKWIMIRRFDSNSTSYFSQTRFNFWFRRKFSAYVDEMLLPSFALALLQLGFLALPPEGADRTVYCATILMAYAFLQQIIQMRIPKTSETILVVIFISIQLVFSMFSTLYSLVAAMIAPTKFANRIITFNRPLIGIELRLIRLLDFIMFIVLSFAVFVISLVIFLEIQQ